MTRLFERRVVVAVGELSPADLVLTTPTGDTFDGFRTSFKVERDLKSTPNTFEVSVSNPSEEMRAKLATYKHTRVWLQAGWTDEVSTLLIGDARAVDSYKRGTDWVTRFQGGEGERAIQHGRVSKSYRPGAQAFTVARDMAKAFVSDPGNLEAKIAAAAGVFSSGFVAQGNAATELTGLLNRHGLTWSVQNGRLEVLGANEWIGEMGPLLAPDTGLVGTPELGSPDVKTGKSITKIRCLLNAQISPGRRFAVRLKPRGDNLVELNTDAVYVALKVTHHGDTHGGDFYTDIEATPA